MPDHWVFVYVCQNLLQDGQSEQVLYLTQTIRELMLKQCRLVLEPYISQLDMEMMFHEEERDQPFEIAAIAASDLSDFNVKSALNLL